MKKPTKAILVINEMPSDCYHCPLHDYEYLWCYAKNDSSMSMEENIESKRNDNCPLRPLPQKMAVENRWFSKEHAEGWNACLEEITGETE